MSRQNQRYAARLRKLDTILGQVPDSEYDHSQYIDVSNITSSCKTVGCALGHAVASKQFAGLGITYTGLTLDIFGSPFSFRDIDGVSFYTVRPGFESWAEKYFGPGTYERIFDVSPYRHLEVDYLGPFGEEGGLLGSLVKAAVQENLREVAAEFEAA